MLKKNIASILSAAILLPNLVFGQATPAPVNDNSAVAKFKDEGMNRSQAMATMRYLSDVIGARLTNSPAQRRANRWTKEQLEKWGMKNAAVDSWGEFGRGWELKRFSASVSLPEEYMNFRAYPKAWSPATNGAVTGNVVFVDATDEAGLEKYKGKLKGAIVLTAAPREVKPGFEPAATRVTDEALAKMEQSGIPQPRPGQSQRQANPQQFNAFRFNARKFRFYIEEGVVALVEPSSGVDAGTIRVMGASVPQPENPAGTAPTSSVSAYSKNAPATVPQLVAETEQYNRLFRLVQQNVPAKMTLDLDAKFYDDDLQGYNTIAEIPGSDLKDEVVMIGAHLDSWHSGTGATDNGAGVTVVMEAMRILQASGFKPRRTIRVGLWTGEEQGLHGSRGYVAKYLAGSPNNQPGAAAVKKPSYDKFAAYYNLDNGTGQIRGINMQGNEALRPIFREWVAPFKDYNATTVTVNSVGGTDHLAFDAVGLPGFQFVQDPIEYFTRTWHTTQDVSDRILEEDLKRSAIIMATFAYNSAMTNEKLPRKTAQANALAQILGRYDLQSDMEETAFHFSGLDHSICGHQIEQSAIPNEFPLVFSVALNRRFGNIK